MYRGLRQYTLLIKGWLAPFLLVLWRAACYCYCYWLLSARGLLLAWSCYRSYLTGHCQIVVRELVDYTIVSDLSIDSREFDRQKCDY
jgi:hypothetical protein